MPNSLALRHKKTVRRWKKKIHARLHSGGVEANTLLGGGGGQRDTFCMSVPFLYICRRNPSHIVLFLYVYFQRAGLRIRIRNPEPDPGGQKWPTKVEKIKSFVVLKCWIRMASFESWRLLLLLGRSLWRHRDRLIVVFDQKILVFFQLSFFQFLFIIALDPDWIQIRIGIQPKMLDPDPDEMNADPQPCQRESFILYLPYQSLSNCAVPFFFICRVNHSQMKFRIMDLRILIQKYYLQIRNIGYRVRYFQKTEIPKLRVFV